MDTSTHILRLQEQARHRAKINRAQKVLGVIEEDTREKLVQNATISSALSKNKSEYSEVLEKLHDRKRISDDLYEKKTALSACLMEIGAAKSNLEQLEDRARRVEDEIQATIERENNAKEERLININSEIEAVESNLRDLEQREEKKSKEYAVLESKLFSLQKELDEVETKVLHSKEQMIHEVQFVKDELQKVNNAKLSLAEREKKLNIYASRLKRWSGQMGIQIPNL